MPVACLRRILCVVVVLGGGFLASCGNQKSAASPANSAGPSLESIALFERPQLGRDRMPRLAYESDYGDVTVDFVSARRVRVRTKRYAMWITRGTKSGGENWNAGFNPSVVCLHLFDARGTPVAFQCASAGEALMLGRVFVLLSGGAEGAPGLRPHEVVMAGLAPVGARELRVVSSRGKGTPVGVQDGAFVLLTRRSVDGLEVRGSQGERDLLPLNACQEC